MSKEITKTIIVFLIIYSLILTLFFIFSIDLINDKTQYNMQLQKENKRCEIQLDSLKNDYERLQNEYK